MMKVYKRITKFLVIAVAVNLLLSSCSSTKKTKFFQDIPDSGRLKSISKAEYIEPKIQADDILTIIIQTVDPQASMVINSGNVSTNSSANTITTPMSSLNSPTTNLTASLGYLVDDKGEVTIPVLGKVKVEGFTTSEARQAIFNVADHFYKSASVIVRFANFKVNVAGEVARPGTYIMPNERVTVLDAITMAGDLTIYGKRENVLIIRQNPDGTKTPYRINLKKTNFMTSPYFYLRQNDYIYVEANNGKIASSDAAQARLYTIIGSALSVLIILFTVRR